MDLIVLFQIHPETRIEPQALSVVCDMLTDLMANIIIKASYHAKRDLYKHRGNYDLISSLNFCHYFSLLPGFSFAISIIFITNLR